jgi:hypothetical protein
MIVSDKRHRTDFKCVLVWQRQRGVAWRGVEQSQRAFVCRKPRPTARHADTDRKVDQFHLTRFVGRLGGRTGAYDREGVAPLPGVVRRAADLEGDFAAEASKLSSAANQWSNPSVTGRQTDT